MTDALLTAAEVIATLRLDRLKDPASALAHLRRTRRLPAVKLFREMLYRQADLDRLIAQSLQNGACRTRLSIGKPSRRRKGA